MVNKDIHGPLPQYAEQSNPLLEAVARRDAYYDRNRAKICTFYIRGACTRGKLCPFRHEMPVDNELANQNIKDRYHGNNDPVAAKILHKISDIQTTSQQLQPPADQTICTLFLSSIPEGTTYEFIKTTFEQYGEISSLKYLEEKRCAILTYLYRSSAEEAVIRTNGYVKSGNAFIRVGWTKKRDDATKASQDTAASGGELPAIPPPEILPTNIHTLRYTSMESDYTPVTKRPKLPPGL
uniref:Zinc finger CCCH domain-containing protein 25 n=1 Tax=Lygus hesperus TaxID=30085 RepID=A0A0A9Z002_LYGHE